MRELTIVVPSWVGELVAEHGDTSDVDAQMRLAIALAAENVARGGGPFGAAVFDGPRCIGAGVNRVLDSGYSIAHAEIVGLMAAQHARAGVTVTSPPSLTLVTSAEPCCQCFGALVWSGIDRLICGATTADVEAIGFDEGPKPHDWQAQLRARGLSVRESVLRAEASAVLRDYQARGGVIYGLRSPRMS